MTIVTLCGSLTNEGACMGCIQMRDCRERRETLCKGCKREYGPCLREFQRKMQEAGGCRGREMVVSTQMRTIDEITQLHGKGI